MTPVLLFFLAGVALLAADVFASSFVLAVAGAASMVAGCVAAYGRFGPTGAGAAGLIALFLLGFTIWFEIVVLPRTRLGRGLVVRSTSGAAQPPPAPESVVGQPAEALTTLAPSGYVRVGESRYEAYCQSGHAPRGAALKVVGRDNFRVIVSKS